MASTPANPNTKVLIGAAVVLVVGVGGILAYKGYFSPSRDSLRNESRFTKFAEKAAETPWQAEAPTALAAQVKFRIERDMKMFNDKRFDAFKARFGSSERMHKQGKQSNTQYQASLVALGNELGYLEMELAPNSGAGNGENPKGSGGPGKVPEGNSAPGKKGLGG